jgi:hypothetical protein
MGEGGPGAPIRTRRNELTLVLEALTYARAFFPVTWRSCVSGVPATQSASRAWPTTDRAPWASPRTTDEATEPTDDEDEAEFNLAIFDRTDQVVSAHHELARVDLTSQVDVARVLAAVDEQPAGLTTRREAAEARLRQIRAVVIRQCQQATPPRASPPGHPRLGIPKGPRLRAPVS